MQFIDEFKNFAKNTISGQESGLYKSLYLHKIEIENVDNIRSDVVKILLQYTIMDYLNGCYKSLILKNDDYVLTSFEKMKKEKNHSDICLLNILFVIIRSAITDIDRHKFNDTSYDKFMYSMQREYEIFLNAIDYEKLLNHECSGEKIENCNPEEPLFYIK